MATAAKCGVPRVVIISSNAPQAEKPPIVHVDIQTGQIYINRLAYLKAQASKDPALQTVKGIEALHQEVYDDER